MALDLPSEILEKINSKIFWNQLCSNPNKIKKIFHQLQKPLKKTQRFWEKKNLWSISKICQPNNSARLQSTLQICKKSPLEQPYKELIEFSSPNSAQELQGIRMNSVSEIEGVRVFK